MILRTNFFTAARQRPNVGGNPLPSASSLLQPTAAFFTGARQRPNVTLRPDTQKKFHDFGRQISLLQTNFFTGALYSSAPTLRKELQ